MAKDYSSIITLGAIGAAVWYAYEQGWFSNLLGTAAAAPAVAGNTPAAAINCPSPSTIINGVCTAPAQAPTAQQQQSQAPAAATPKPIPTAAYSQADQTWALQVAELSSSNTLDIDQWNYYFNQLATSTWSGTLTPISGSQMSAMLAQLANLGQDRSAAMTLPQWYWLVTAGGGGLSGFGNYFGIPAGAIHGGW